jgi:hypothetical protein
MRKRPDLDTFDVATRFYVHSPTGQLVAFLGWAMLPTSFVRTSLSAEEAERDVRDLADLDDETEAVAVFHVVHNQATSLLIATQAGYDLGERFQPASNDAAAHSGELS